jgi:hypothetical protein
VKELCLVCGATATNLSGASGSTPVLRHREDCPAEAAAVAFAAGDRDRGVELRKVAEAMASAQQGPSWAM